MDNFDERLNELHDRVIGNALSDEERANYSESLFDSIKHINDYGQEFWYARDLQIALKYTQWRRFNNVIEKAKIACENSGFSVSEHFANIGKTSPMPNGGTRTIEEYDVYGPRTLEALRTNLRKSKFVTNRLLLSAFFAFIHSQREVPHCP